MKKGTKVQFTTKDGIKRQGTVISKNPVNFGDFKAVTVEWVEGGIIISRIFDTKQLTIISK